MSVQYRLCVKRFKTREEMGQEAAQEVGNILRSLLAQKTGDIRMIFAAAPSQNEFLSALCDQDVDFSRIVAFHMDEFVGLPGNAPQGFANFLRARIFEKVPFRTIHYLNGNAENPEAECARYGALLRQEPIDVVCMGIGENGHIAFNDPSVADLHDPFWVKKVNLDEICRMQQVHDGCFSDLSLVPTHALTLTIPALMSAKHHYCIVPASAKANAVRSAIYNAVSESCPATALRLSPDATLYLDEDSARLL